MASDEQAVLERLLTAANAIHDPCSMARGLNFGIVDMGMIRQARARETDSGWNVVLRIGLTAPACAYMGYFEEHLRTAAAELPEVASLLIEWDDAFDWTPDNLSPSARARLEDHRRRLEDIYRARIDVAKTKAEVSG